MASPVYCLTAPTKPITRQNMVSPTRASASSSGATSTSSSSSGGPLKSSFLATPGDPTMNLEMWIRLFDYHILAHNLDSVPEKRKLAILRSSLGAEKYRICADLCPETDLSYADTIDRLKQRFQPPSSQILAREQFNRRIHQSSEDTAQFATALSALAAKCV